MTDQNPFPHKHFAARIEGDGQYSGPRRRKHNGRLRRLPHRGRLKTKMKHDLRMLSWAFRSQGGWHHLVDKLIRYKFRD